MFGKIRKLMGGDQKYQSKDIDNIKCINFYFSSHFLAFTKASNQGVT